MGNGGLWWGVSRVTYTIMYIIGIAGKKESGKTTLAKFILKYKKNAVIINFADALKLEVAKACGVTVEDMEKEKSRFRPIQQWWGTEFRRYYKDDYWITQWLAKVNAQPKNTLIIAADVRFKNECEIIKSLGCPVWKVVRDGRDTDAHISETELDKLNFHIIIDNNQGLSNLEAIAKKLASTL